MDALRHAHTAQYPEGFLYKILQTTIQHRNQTLASFSISSRYLESLIDPKETDFSKIKALLGQQSA